MGNESYDVVVVGGGPAGSVMAWSLAHNGVRVALVERARFPREKVCGDFIEPGGLRILDAMGCLGSIQAKSPYEITKIRAFINAETVFQGDIPYYKSRDQLPPCGYIVPRSEFDSQLLGHADKASATVYQGCSVDAIDYRDGRATVNVSEGKREFTLTAPLLVGADGVASTVARSVGLASRNDPRYTSISQRAYADNVTALDGEASIWFDEDLYPGYGWMFPMPGGRANVGVGMLAETCQRYHLSVPELFRSFIGKLKQQHSGCANLMLVRKPIGGIVKSYAGIARNTFDGGLLVGDAGGFVDPMTGEGITQGMESALIASRTVIEALEQGRFDQSFLTRYERDYRQHFDPTMRYLDWCATVMRNRHMRKFCLRALKRAYRNAMSDHSFASVAGSSFGGLDLRPSSALIEVFSNVARHTATGSVATVLDWFGKKSDRSREFREDIGAWSAGMRASMLDDPRWHLGWTRDVARSSSRLMFTSHNPRMRGVALPGPRPTSSAE